MPTTLPPRLVAERYHLAAGVPEDAGTVLVPATDTLLDRPVLLLILPPEASLARRLEQRRAAGRPGAQGAHLAAVLDAGDLDGRTYLVLPADAGQLLSERLRERGPLAPEAAAGVALAVLAARRSLRSAGRPGGGSVAADTVLVGGGDPARLVPVAREGAPAVDDAAPVRGLYRAISAVPSALAATADGDEDGLQAALSRLAGPEHATDVLPSRSEDARGTAALPPLGLPAAGATAAVVAPGPGPGTRPGRRGGLVVAAVASLAAAGVLVSATLAGNDPSDPSAPPAAVAVAPPAPDAAAQQAGGDGSAAPLPTDAAELLGALREDPALADPVADQLLDRLAAVTSAPVGEARRQLGLEVADLGRTDGVDPRVTGAVEQAMAPVLALDTPADMIADLGPDPALGGPEAVNLLQCMQWFIGRDAQQQQEEARQILQDLPGWAAGGGIRPDLVDAAVRIVTPVADGGKVFTPEEAGAELPGMDDQPRDTEW